MKYIVSLLFVVVANNAAINAFSPSIISKTSTALNVNLNRETGKSQLDPAVLERYQSLPFPSDKVLAEYVWVDAVGNLRSKTRTLPVERVSIIIVIFNNVKMGWSYTYNQGYVTTCGNFTLLFHIINIFYVVSKCIIILVVSMVFLTIFLHV
jgi:hypothetical protein